MREYMNIFFPCGVAWIIAQVVKNLIAKLKKEKTNIAAQDIVATGGMPSSHTAVAAAMAVRIGLTDGFSSSLFAMCAIILFTTIVDATNVRFAVGEQTAYINKLMKEHSHRTGETFRELKIVKGHTFFQVLMGLTLGVAVALWYELLVQVI